MISIESSLRNVRAPNERTPGGRCCIRDSARRGGGCDTRRSGSAPRDAGPALRAVRRMTGLSGSRLGEDPLDLCQGRRGRRSLRRKATGRRAGGRSARWPSAIRAGSTPPSGRRILFPRPRKRDPVRHVLERDVPAFPAGAKRTRAGLPIQSRGWRAKSPRSRTSRRDLVLEIADADRLGVAALPRSEGQAPIRGRRGPSSRKGDLVFEDAQVAEEPERDADPRGRRPVELDVVLPVEGLDLGGRNSAPRPCG